MKQSIKEAIEKLVKRAGEQQEHAAAQGFANAALLLSQVALNTKEEKRSTENEDEQA